MRPQRRFWWTRARCYGAALDAVLVLMIPVFATYSTRAAVALIPYLAWVSFATALNYSIRSRNRAQVISDLRLLTPAATCFRCFADHTAKLVIPKISGSDADCRPLCLG